MNEMGPTSGKAAADVGIRDGVASFLDPLGDPADGECGRRDPEVVKLDQVADGFRLIELLGVGRAAQGAFETE